MKNKEMIEEMARDWDYVAHMLRFNDCYMLSLKQWREPAREMIKLGWIKPTEDSVVLSKEEYNDMFSFKTTRGGFYNILDTVRKVERKETVEKILNYLHTYEMYFDEIENVYKITATLSKSELKELKQIGVEIKE